MGVKGLLQALNDVTIAHSTPEATLGDFRGKRLAVDLSSWLYRGAYSCASELALGRPTKAYVFYVMHRLGLLR